MLLLVFAFAAGALPNAPSPAQLANTLEKFRGARVHAADIRAVSCEDIEEEPTEFLCSWQQKKAGRWRGYSTYMAIEGRGWLLIDEPAPKRRSH